MAVQRVNIQNFTVFSDFVIELCKGVNLIIGENGVGKTHLLKMIYHLIQSRQRYGNQTSHMSERMYVNENIPTHSIASLFDIDDGYAMNNLSSATSSMTLFEGIGSIHAQVVYIPAKEMLSHAKGLVSMKKKYGENMPFDETLLDIIEKAQAWKLSQVPPFAENIIPALERIIDGVVEVKDDGSFWVNKTDGRVIPFSMEAEGYKQFGMLWQLIMNESVSPNTIVLWDEPESSINPKNIPVLVETMLALHRHDVQIIAATHNYNFLRYFDISRTKSDNIRFFSLYKGENAHTCVAQSDNFNALFPNSVDDAGEQLFKDAISKAMGDT